MPNISAADLQRAKQTLAEGQTIRNEADRELIMNGCWPADGVDLLLNEEGENIAIEGGKVSGIAEAVQRFKARNPDDFDVAPFNWPALTVSRVSSKFA